MGDYNSDEWYRPAHPPACTCEKCVRAQLLNSVPSDDVVIVRGKHDPSQNASGTRETWCHVCGGYSGVYQFREGQYYKDDYGMFRCISCKGIVSPTEIDGYIAPAKEISTSKKPRSWLRRLWRQKE